MTMQHFTCEDISAVLSGLLDDELDANERHRAEVHLAQCDACRTLVSDAEEMDRDLRQAVVVREAWSENREKQIWNEIHDPDQGRLQIRRYRFAAWTGWLAAAAATIIAGVVFFGSWGNVNGPAGVNRPGEGGPDLTASTANEGARSEQDRISPSVIESNDTGASDDEADIERTPRVSAKVYTNGPIWVGPLDDDDDGSGFVSNADPGESANVIASSRPVVGDRDGESDEPRHDDDPADSVSHDGFAVTPVSIPDPEYVAMARDDRTTSEAAVISSDPNSDEKMATTPEEIEGDWRFGTDDVLYQTSVLMDLLERADENSFADLHQINQILEYDDVLDRLARIRGEVDGDTQALVERAWAALEWVNGPVDQEQLRTIKRLIAEDQIPQRLETLSNRYASQ